MKRSNAVPPQKKQLRRRFRQRRDALEPEAAARASAQLCERLQNKKCLAQATAIAGYMALGQEIDIKEYLSRRLQDEGVRLFLPRVTGPGQMEFCAIESWEELRPGPFGIEEPTGPSTATEEIEIFLVPGLAFDFHGQRLGFGKGFYDRALPEKGKATAIGVAHHWQLLETPLPAEPHDRPMDFIATDRDWHSPGVSGLTT